MYEVITEGLRVYSDFIVFSPSHEKLVMANLMERAKYSLQSTVANIYKNMRVDVIGNDYSQVLKTSGDYTGYIETHVNGKTNYYQSIVKSKKMFSNLSSVDQMGYINVVFIENENQTREEVLFDVLYQTHDLPLKREWSKYLYTELKREHIEECTVLKSKDFSHIMKEGDISTNLNKWRFFHLVVETRKLDEIVSYGLKSGQIKIAETPQKQIEVSSIDDYFQRYGAKVIENVVDTLEPALPLIQTVDYPLLNKTPLPAQAELINGIHHHLKTKEFCIINGGMGVGKSLIASTSVAMSAKKGRVALMAPSIMLKKWKSEILEEIPGATVKIIRDFADVLELREKKGVQPDNLEFYVFSKDFAKLSYEKVPTVYQSKSHTLPIKRCNACLKVHYDSYNLKECSCGSVEFKALRTNYQEHGAVCPECKELVMKPNAKVKSIAWDDKNTTPVLLDDFHNPSNKNAICGHCQNQLWGPNVQNYELDNEYASFQRKSKWMKIKVYRNMSKKTTITKYILRSEYEHKVAMGDYTEDNHTVVKIQKSRKYSPAQFIKKYIGKGFFQYAIIDEVHQLKSGNSAQGNALGQIIKASEKTLLLTGTLLGGVAVDLFYILYRVDPQLMRSRGYSWDCSMKFAEDYGVVEEKRVFDDETVYYNKTSNGRSVGTKKVLPGISPLIVSDFLINNTVFLDLSDFEVFMPEIEEIPIGVKMSDKQSELYNDVYSNIKSHLREKGGRKLLGQVLPTMLALPDVCKLDNIIHPLTGHNIYSFFKPREHYYNEDGLLNKEIELLKIVKSELAENRNVFVYAEFTATGDKNVPDRLKRVLEEHLDLHGQVEVLRSSSPQAFKRMDWIKEKASKGIRVFITNPKNVEVGLDFIFKHNDKVYNYPTIVFYQLGYQLFVAWQASARHLRLVQTKNCKTYYLYYENTMQETALSALANKKAATAAVQGTFSEEGLIAMANSVDPRVLLANALMNGTQNEDINKLFSKINNKEKGVLSDLEKELMKNIISNFSEDENVQSILKNEQLSLETLSDVFMDYFDLKVNESSIGIGKNALNTGQMTLF